MDGRAEFIGENVTVSYHTDPSLHGVSGKIINETRIHAVIVAVIELSNTF